VIKRLTLSAVLAASLSATACAREAESTETALADPATSGAAVLVQETQAPEPAFAFPEDAWRDIAPENTIYIETDHGRVVVEMAPEFAPNHVDRMNTLVRERFYDFLVWHRVIDGFMAQGGGSRSNPAHRSELPPLASEFTTRRGADVSISELQDRTVNPSQIPQPAKAGFWNGFAAGTQTLALAGLTGDGQVQSWLLHCEGAAAAARTSDPNSAGSQFYITRGHADHLNAIYTVWGRVRAGQEAVNALRAGTLHQDPGFAPDVIRSMRIADELPEEERTRVQVVDTDSAAFAAYLDTLRDDAGQLPDICEITVPTRIVE
jgi:peptidylprolyl isomerase